jgi:hypothetical protein
VGGGKGPKPTRRSNSKLHMRGGKGLIPSRRSNYKSHTRRSIALTLLAPANRACLCAAHGGRSREPRSLLFAIERLARNRSQNPKSDEGTRRAPLAGIPQRLVEEPFGTRNRNEGHLTTSTGVTRVRDDPGDGMRIAKYSDLRRRMAEFEEQLCRDLQSFSALPRERTVWPRRRTREKRRNLLTFSRFFPTGRSGHETQRKSWRTGLYGEGSRRRQQRGACFCPRAGGKRQKAKVKRQKYCGGGRRRTFRFEFRHLAGAVRRLKAEGRRNSMRCYASRFLC